MMQTSIGRGKVSIVIPCYNHAVMPSEALASVEQVRNANLLEVIIVDDGSSDAETILILKQIAEAGYSVLSQPNRGPVDFTVLQGSSVMLQKHAIKFIYFEFNDLQPKEGTFGGSINADRRTIASTCVPICCLI